MFFSEELRTLYKNENVSVFRKKSTLKVYFWMLREINYTHFSILLCNSQYTIHCASSCLFELVFFPQKWCENIFHFSFSLSWLISEFFYLIKISFLKLYIDLINQMWTCTLQLNFNALAVNIKLWKCIFANFIHLRFSWEIMFGSLSGPCAIFFGRKEGV